jgi:hypothetical protein
MSGYKIPGNPVELRQRKRLKVAESPQKDLALEAAVISLFSQLPDPFFLSHILHETTQILESGFSTTFASAVISFLSQLLPFISEPEPSKSVLWIIL